MLNNNSCCKTATEKIQKLKNKKKRNIEKSVGRKALNETRNKTKGQQQRNHRREEKEKIEETEKIYVHIVADV